MNSAVWLTASRCLAALTVAVVVILFVTAGALIQAHQFEDVHGAAAIALHVSTGALAVALAGLAWQRRTGWWAAGLAAALFAFTFVQAYLGDGTTLAAHVPGALLVTATSISLTCWLFGRRRES